MLLVSAPWHWIQSVGQKLYLVALTLGGPGLFLIAAGDSSFLSVPEGNDVLIVVLSVGQSWGTMAYYVAMTILGSITGCLMLYSLGRRGGSFMRGKIGPERLADLEKMYGRWGAWAVVIPSILPPPTPFKVFVLSAGLFRLPCWKFVLAVLLGRTIRYSLWGVLALLYGEAAHVFLKEHVTQVGSVLFALLLAGVALYLYFWFRARHKTSEEMV